MKLFYSGNSPYARRPRIAIRQFDMMDQVEEQDVAPLNTVDHVLFTHGPGGRVPALLTDNGTFLCETLIICRHLDEASGGKLYPTDPAAREFSFRVEGVGSLLMDSLFVRAHDSRRDPSEQSPGEQKTEATRAARIYDELESLVDQFSGNIDMGTLSVAASLGYADWRHAEDKWRAGRSKLAAWHDEVMMKLPSVKDTYPAF